MHRFEIEQILKEIHPFAGLTDEQRALIIERSSIRDYPKGCLMYAEGSPADAFYCLLVGRVVIYTTDEQGRRHILEYLHRGKYFGIISLLTGDTHSVTAQALNDSVLLVMAKEEFDRVIQLIPGLALDLGLSLSRRLKNKDLHRKTIFESKVLAVFDVHSQKGTSVYSLNLALSLKRETRKNVLLVELSAEGKTHGLPQCLNHGAAFPVVGLAQGLSGSYAALRTGILQTDAGIDLLCVSYPPQDEAGAAKHFVEIASVLVNDYHYLILDMPAVMDGFVLRILNQADLVHILAAGEELDLKRTFNLIGRLREEFSCTEQKIQVIINEYRLSNLSHEEQCAALGQPVFATLPRIELRSGERLVIDEPQAEYAKSVRRIARTLGEMRVGLALGVGAGYGFCHIGVLKVIEEERIPVDVISGSSIGALIASLWVTGRSAQEILEISQEFREQKYLWRLIDLTVPVLGFIKGGRLQKFLKRYLGTKTFRDVNLPLKIIASDIKRKEPRILDRGPLVDAIMASCSMPGVFRPFRLKEEILFDGGVINPLPTEVLFSLGIRKIIGVNVTPSREDILRQYEKVKSELAERPAPARAWRDTARRFAQKLVRENIVDIIFSSIEVMQSELARKEEELADVVLHPDTRGLHWMEFHRAAEFAARGEEEARRNLERIRQIVNE